MVFSVSKRVLLCDSAEVRYRGCKSTAISAAAVNLSRIPDMAVARPNGRRFRAGEVVRQSGIYEVIHDREHRELHEAVMISGRTFPGLRNL